MPKRPTAGSWRPVPVWLILCALGTSIAAAQPLPQRSGLFCKEVATALSRNADVSSGKRAKLRRRVELAIPPVADPRYAAQCYHELARGAAEDGDYDAERLYLRSAELAPDDPHILEAVGRYYRVYRGSHGLFADSEAFYLRAEKAALDAESAAPNKALTEPPPYIALDSIRRGRIDLLRDDGLGLLIPRQPGDQFGLYFASLLNYGRFALPQAELGRITNQPLPTPPAPPVGGPSPPPAPTADADANARVAIQNRNRLDLLERLRVRYGKLPYLDVLWARSSEEDVAPLMQPPPPTPAPGMPPPAPPGLALDDSTRSNVVAAIEDDAGFAPFGDLLWRLEYVHERRKPDHAEASTTDRATVSATWTRNLGRLKTDFAALAGSSFDGEYIAGGDIHVVHFFQPAAGAEWSADWIPPSADGRRALGGASQGLGLSPPPRPPSNDYMLGYRREELNTPEGSRVINHGAHAGAHFLDALPARTDVAMMSSLNLQHPQHGGPDTGDVELRVDLINRLIDRLLEPDTPRTDRRLATNRASPSLGYIEDLAVRGTDRFESRGLNAGVRLETFSAPLNFGTVVVECSYQLRDYYHIGEVRHVPWISVRAGLGGP